MVPHAWFGSCAIGHREPCQVRKEAAISGSSYVPQISLLLRLRSFQRAISVFLVISIFAGWRAEHVYSIVQSVPTGDL